MLLAIYEKSSNVSIFVSWLSSSLYFDDSMRYTTSISNSLFFCILFLTTLDKAGLKLTTQSKLMFESNYLKSIIERLSFKIYLCQKQVKLLALSFYTTLVWKYQRCKCTMVYLKDSFIVSSFLFLFIHNIALLQGPVAITTYVQIENL